MMHLEVLRRTIVDAQRIDPQPHHAAFHQQLCGFNRVPRKVHHLVRVHIPIARHIRNPRAPSRSQHRDRALRNLPMLRFPLFNPRNRQPVIRILGCLFANVDHNPRPEKMRVWNLIEGHLPRRKMCRRVHVRPIVLQHPEAAREVSVLLHRRVHFRLEHPVIPRPRRKFIVHRVSHVDHHIFPGRNSMKPIPRRCHNLFLRRTRRYHCKRSRQHQHCTAHGTPPEKQRILHNFAERVKHMPSTYTLTFYGLAWIFSAPSAPSAVRIPSCPSPNSAKLSRPLVWRTSATPFVTWPASPTRLPARDTKFCPSTSATRLTSTSRPPPT